LFIKIGLIILDIGGPKSMANLIEFETYLVEELEKKFEVAFEEKFDA
jgi:hypothetical protein